MVTSYGTGLLGKPSHDNINKLLDYELKMLECAKKMISNKMKIDHQYAKELLQLSSQCKLERPTYESGLFKAWDQILESFSAHGNAIKKAVEAVNMQAIEKINNLIKNKIAIKRHYVEFREQMDESLTQTVKTDLEARHKYYLKIDNEASLAKKNYETIIESKKGNAKSKLKAQDKYRKSTMKLRIAHNDYFIHLQEARSHQQYYRETTLPSFLENVGQLQEEFVKTVKGAFTEYVTHTSPLRDDMKDWQSHCESAVLNIDPTTEYKDFISQNGSPLESEVNLNFDKVPGEGNNLPCENIVIDTLTLQSVEVTANDYMEDITQLDGKLEDQENKLMDVCSDIGKIHQDYNKFSKHFTPEALGMMEKYLERAQLTIEKTDTYRIRKTYHDISSYLNNKLQLLGDSKPPSGLELPDVETNNNSQQQGDVGDYHRSNSVNVVGSVGKLFRKLTSREDQKSPTKKNPVDSIKPFDLNKQLEDQPWFHGQLPREEASRLLMDDGDFLVRESKNAGRNVVLSHRHQGVTHIKIDPNNAGRYSFDGYMFESVVEVINYYYTTGAPITSKAGGHLLNPICRFSQADKFRLLHDDIELTDKIGSGNFGNVYKGYIRSRDSMVAVKTCKESVDQSARAKFLSEAKILEKYDHRNIVKLIGVATDREPIYIVMELVEGGDLRKFLGEGRGNLQGADLTKMCRDACEGLAYLELNNCIHRDVAARNCLVSHSNGITVKITDFGMSREEEDGVYKVDGRLRSVPMKWTAPEAMNFGKFTHASDVWSYGVLTWEVFSFGGQPYPRMTNQQARSYVDKGNRMEKPDLCPTAFYDQIMMTCWQKDADKRPTFAQISSIIKSLIRKGDYR